MSSNISKRACSAAAILAIAGAIGAASPATAAIPAPPPHSSHVAGGVGFPAVIIGVASVLGLYDVVRRTTCSGDFLGLGGPGFSEPIRPNQNVLPPRCPAQPAR